MHVDEHEHEQKNENENENHDILCAATKHLQEISSTSSRREKKNKFYSRNVYCAFHV